MRGLRGFFFIIIAPIFSLFANNPLFVTSPCRAFFDQLIHDNLHRERWQQVVQERGNPQGAQRYELVQRLMRIEWLERSRNQSIEQYRSLFNLIRYYEEHLRFGSDSERAWNNALVVFAARSNLIGEQSDSLVFTFLPDFIPRGRSPADLTEALRWRDLAYFRSYLAALRVAYSESLSRHTPLSRRLSQSQEQHQLLALLDLQNFMVQNAYDRSRLIELPQSAAEIDRLSFATARTALTMSSVPESIREELRTHLDFCERYGVSAGAPFFDFTGAVLEQYSRQTITTHNLP